MSILTKIFGSYSEKELKRIKPIADKIDSYEAEYKQLSDSELSNKTIEFKKRLTSGETLDDILPEAYATVREAAFRTIKQRPFRVQVIGGIVLHQGRISEMRTGEGKTLTCTMPAYLNALTGKGVHVVTVNDYLAKLQGEWMGNIHRFLGLTVGVILHDMNNDERREAYACDITYVTNNELGFDYLRDNMVVYLKDCVQRELEYAIIDEVDSILIDEARTPLIISGSSGKSTQLYKIADIFVKGLKKGRILNEDQALNALTRTDIIEEGDFVVDEKQKTTSLTQEGVRKAEKYFVIENLADPDNLEIQHHINNALKANNNMHSEKDYVVKENEVVIVDEFTGRLMPGRRYSDGLHQAIEAKEGVEVNRESKTLATITFQNFFNKYSKKSGMTGTALTEEGEFRQIYNMDVVEIPTNRPMIRKDLPDRVYKDERSKFNAVVADVKECYEKGQPVLVGTITIDKSEILSNLLKREGIPHQVLNAKYHEKEAEIVSRGGQHAAVTIATNMAGRGTDIMLGEGVSELGGLKIIGTERHESRRIDNQLRGRSGRQGDPGVSRFYVSLEDDLMRLFVPDGVKNIVTSLGLNDDEPIEHNMLSKAIENAQKKVEGNNFATRKHLLDYDRVMNEQREIIYGERRKVLQGEDLSSNIREMLKDVITRAVAKITDDSKPATEWEYMALNEGLIVIFHKAVITKSDLETYKDKESIIDFIYEKAMKLYSMREQEFTSEKMREIERIILLKVIDARWMDHIDDMDQMRQGITLRAFAQRDPLVEYKFLSFDMFEELSNTIQQETIFGLFNVRLATQPEKREQVAKPLATNKDDSAVKTPTKRKDDKVGRNDPCPCGSGQKYKNCHGK